MTDQDTAARPESNGKEPKVVKKATDRTYWTADGEETNDATEAVSATVVYYDSDKLTPLGEIHWAPKSDDPTTRAMALFGFGTHAGNHRNRLVNTQELTGDAIIAGMMEYEQAILVEGGWTNRSGEATAGAGLFIEAYARYRDVPVEKVRANWERWDDASREAVKKNPRIKALVDQIRAERSAERAARAEETEDNLPDVE